MAKKMDKNDIEKLSFEQAITALNDIVGRIESGQTPLETSIEQYEQGMALIKHCRGILEKAQKKIEVITAAEKTAKQKEKPQKDPGTAEQNDEDLF